MQYIIGWSGGAVSEARLQELVGRAGEIRWFLERLNEPTPRSGIVQLIAPSGHGKSWLCSALLQKYARRIRGHDDYDHLAGWSDEEFAAKALTHVVSEQLPAAYVDLETASDPIRAFLALRGRLQSLKMPRFDFVLFVLLRRMGKLDLVALREIFPAEAADFVVNVLDAALEIADSVPLVPAVLAILSRYCKEDTHQYLRQRKVDAELIERVKEASNHELRELLPQVFAADLNLAACERPVVLFFDSVDMVQPSGPASSHDLLRRDEWLRVFLRSLDPEPATLVVLATTQPLSWAGAAAFPVPSETMETLELRGLSDAAAEDFLIAHGVADDERRAEMLALSQAGPDEHSPLLLYLQTLNASHETDPRRFEGPSIPPHTCFRASRSASAA